MRGIAGAALAVRLLQSHGGKQHGAALSREHTVAAMTAFMARINLRTSPPILHIAGTKGKGSTAVMCESILRAAGLTTGLFTSPHLVDIRERVRVNGELADSSLFCRHFWHIWDVLEVAARDGLAPAKTAVPDAFQPPPPDVLARMPGFFQVRAPWRSLFYRAVATIPGSRHCIPSCSF
jgi:hypothetical protein